MNTNEAVKWQEKVKFNEKMPIPQTLLEDTQVRVVLGGLVPDQIIPAHPEAKGIYTVVEGEGQMTVGDNTFPVSPGSVILVPNGVLRGFQAASRLVFIAVRVQEDGVGT